VPKKEVEKEEQDARRQENEENCDSKRRHDRLQTSCAHGRVIKVGTFWAAIAEGEIMRCWLWRRLQSCSVHSAYSCNATSHGCRRESGGGSALHSTGRSYTQHDSARTHKEREFTDE